MWVRAKNGNVFDVPERLAAALVAQGHQAFGREAEARGVDAPKRTRTKPAKG